VARSAGAQRKAGRRWLIAALVGLSTALAVPGAQAAGDDAQKRITARKLGAEAVKLYDTGYHAAALEKFEAAISLLPAPTLYLYSARCLVKLGRLVEASERYLMATRMTLEKNAPAVMLRAQVDAAVERDKLVPTIPQVKIDLSGPTGAGVKVLLDGRDLPRAMLGEKIPVDPGRHVVRAERADTTIEREVTLAPTESTQLLLALPPLPPPPAPPVPVTPPLRIAGWVGLGVGAAGLAAFAVNGAIALALGDSLTNDPMCQDNLCDPSLQGKVGNYGTARVATTVGLVVGLVGASAGLPLIFLNPVKMPAKARITPFIGAGGAGLRGSF
jgi:tetratricopeptide (TPR) repeat protein